MVRQIRSCTASLNLWAASGEISVCARYVLTSRRSAKSNQGTISMGTLGIDIGGSGVKGAIVDTASGQRATSMKPGEAHRSTSCFSKRPDCRLSYTTIQMSPALP